MSDNYKNSNLYKFYLRSPYRSVKHSGYFQVYDEIFENFINKKFTFVEVGIHNGGSLFMWREFFGEDARIIGVDLNPKAKQFEKYGFEIFIGDQSDKRFWKSFFDEVGDIDVLIDDGGHTYEQQIITVTSTIDFVKNNGLIVVEDTHTSYFKKFGYPTKYTFVNWSKKIIDNINSRSQEVVISNPLYKNKIHSVEFFDSIVVFKINKNKSVDSKPTSNESKTLNFEDYRFFNSNHKILNYLNNIEQNLYPKKEKNFLIKLILKINSLLLINYGSFINNKKTKKIKKYF
tara:strand:- start:4525 stop:5388 length:864 start_codon:yes stop_codon:yes gene_type:complete